VQPAPGSPAAAALARSQGWGASHTAHQHSEGHCGACGGGCAGCSGAGPRCGRSSAGSHGLPALNGQCPPVYSCMGGGGGGLGVLGYAQSPGQWAVGMMMMLGCSTGMLCVKDCTFLFQPDISPRTHACCVVSFFWSEQVFLGSEQVTRAESSNREPPLKRSGKRTAQPDSRHPVTGERPPHATTWSKRAAPHGAACTRQASGPYHAPAKS